MPALDVTPLWEQALSFQAEVRRRSRVEELAQVLARHRRSSCVHGWIEVEALAGLMRLVVAVVLGEEDRVQGKVVLDLRVQVVQEVAMVLPHPWILFQADLAPTSPLTRRSLSSLGPLKVEVDLSVVLALILLFGRVPFREDRLTLQGTSSRSRRREYARLEARLGLQVVDYLVEEEDRSDCSTKLGCIQSVVVEGVVAARLGTSSFQRQPTQLIRFLSADFSSMDCSIRSGCSAALADDTVHALVPMGLIVPRLNSCYLRMISLAVLTHCLPDLVAEQRGARLWVSQRPRSAVPFAFPELF